MRTFALMGIVVAAICSTSVMAENFTPVPGKEPARNLHTAQYLTTKCFYQCNGFTSDAVSCSSGYVCNCFCANGTMPNCSCKKAP